MAKETIALVAGAILLIAYLMYVYDMWWGETRPSRSSWWILSFVWGIILFTSMSFNASDDLVAKTSRWLAIASITGSFIVAVSSIWRGSNKKEDNWTKYDIRCAACAGIALVLYFIFHKPEVSFVFAMLADFSGLLPTIENARDYPEQESISAWALTVFSCILGVVAVPQWSLSFESASNWVIPVYLVIVDSIVLYFIYRGWRARKKKQA